MSFRVSWTKRVPKIRPDVDFASEIMQMSVGAMREMGIKRDAAVVCASTPSGVSPRKAMRLYRGVGESIHITKEDISLLRLGLQRIARAVSKWHVARAEYWQKIAEEEEAVACGQQLIFEGARGWETSMTATKPAVSEYAFARAA